LTLVALGVRPSVAAGGIMRLSPHPNSSALSQPFSGPRIRPPAWRVMPGSEFDTGNRYLKPRAPAEP
jgi:hypothetical protein